ncbi:ABC transporter permease [Xanthocytophaga agilis]|uniref:ABC transporter permease n=1 Tax=Xanthocytophaga agilis TaxID=3048010 RepID=A0AAE3R1E2_9BACT|nr:ABC transporter permease [Xanthocytophaga agilis]MDJ1499554.1 ABC transporter permease [Xanthocytophaga agilis]
MLKNYIVIGLRNIFRSKGYTIINILGLAIGIAACLLIFTIVQFEVSYDTFHKNFHRIYRLATDQKYPSGDIGRNPGAPTPAPDALRLDMPQIEKIASINSIYGSQITLLGNQPEDNLSQKKFIEDIGVVFIEPAFFDIFDSQWLIGNAYTSLKDPNTVVLTRTQAEKYFTRWQDAPGNYLKLDNAITLKVTGVIEDAPQNTDFPFKVLVSFETFKTSPTHGYVKDNWGSTSSSHQVFLLLPEKYSVSNLEKALQKFSDKHYSNTGNAKTIHRLLPLSENHFDTQYENLGDHMTSKSTLLTLSFIGILILVMACINFINLATAQAVNRSKEVGIRKVLGSNRLQLIGQFLGETTLIVIFAMVMAIILARLALPFLREISNVPENIPFLQNPIIIAFIILVTLIVSLLSGIYPAIILSGFEPSQALKNKITTRNIGGIPLRRGLVVLQFSISQVLIIGTLIAITQMNFIRDLDLGFTKEAVYVVNINPDDSLNRTHFEGFKRELLQNPAVVSVSLANDPPSSNNNWGRNFSYNNSATDADFNTFVKYADYDYFKTYGLKFVAGKGYSKSDTAKEIVVNETLLRKLGVKDPQEAIGRTLRMGRESWKPIVGVVKDFKANSARDEMKPMVIIASKRNFYTAGVKIHPNHLHQTVDQIKAIWEKNFGAYVFQGHFFDETIEHYYHQENQLALSYKIFATLAIFISCLGLYGLVSFLAVQKTKEIGIRKVLGASIVNIIGLLSKEFIILIAIAFALAIPVAYYLMSNWLDNFVYRISMGVGAFVIAIIITLLIAWITLSYRAAKAALVNPIKSLRSE